MTGLARTAGTVAPVSEQDGTSVLSPVEEADFVARVEEFLTVHARRLGDPSPGTDDGIGEESGLEAARTFQAALSGAGLAGLAYPSEYGGAGLSPRHEELFTRTAADWHLPTATLSISHGMCLPMLNQYGTDDQKDRYLAPNIRGDVVWCQMFSEPGAGSDVASLATRAIRDGDEWVLNGQKVWTSGAQYCEYGLVVARTDPDLPKHQGLSMFIVDLHSTGVEIRPLVQMSGARGFNEVFFTDVRLPAADLLGEVNQGWNLVVSMLMFERVSIGAGGGSLNAVRSPELVALARDRGLDDDPNVRQALADLHIHESIRGFMAQRIRVAVATG